MSVDEKYRSDIKSLKERPVLQYYYYSQSEKMALIEAIEYFESFYIYSSKGLYKGSKTAKQTSNRLCYLKSAREKVTEDIKKNEKEASEIK